MVKYSEKFQKGLDDALAWCDEQDKIMAEQAAKEAEKKRKFHYSFWMAITPVVVSAAWCKL